MKRFLRSLVKVFGAGVWFYLWAIFWAFVPFETATTLYGYGAGLLAGSGGLCFYFAYQILKANFGAGYTEDDILAELGYYDWYRSADIRHAMWVHKIQSMNPVYSIFSQPGFGWYCATINRLVAQGLVERRIHAQHRSRKGKPAGTYYEYRLTGAGLQRLEKRMTLVIPEYSPF